MRHVGIVLPVGAAIVMILAVSPVSAGTVTLSISGVSNNDVVCAGPPNNGNNENCRYGVLQRVQCPAGLEPVSVTVTAGPTEMQTCIDAQNTADFSSCYNVEDVSHEELELEVNGLVVNGGAELNPPIVPPVPLNSDGSGQSIGDLGGCNASFPESLFTYRRPSGGLIQQCTILDTSLATLSETYTPSDPEFSTYYGDPSSGELQVRFAARADTSVDQSGTWNGGVVTNASGSVTISARCEDTPNGVPAVGPVGIGALLLGLSGLGAFVGLRRRG
jgi:hypothetical protein